MSLRRFVVRSNREVHGVRYAFDREYAALRKAGWSDATAFAFAAAATFNRFIPS